MYRIVRSKKKISKTVINNIYPDPALLTRAECIVFNRTTKITVSLLSLFQKFMRPYKLKIPNRGLLQIILL